MIGSGFVERRTDANWPPWGESARAAELFPNQSTLIRSHSRRTRKERASNDRRAVEKP